MDESVKSFVRIRASNRCEYCHMWQDWEPLITYHVEHIVPIQHGGTSDVSNLALACPTCNCHKGPNLSGIDPVTNNVVKLFHPRNQLWEQHFEIRESVVYGRSECGRATVRVLAMNREKRVHLRFRESSKSSLD